MTISQNVQDLLELLHGSVTYIQPYLPSITVGEETVTTYLLNTGETVLEFDDQDSALYIMQRYTKIYESTIEHYAQHAFSHGYQSTHEQELCELREDAREAQAKLRTMHDYGIQQHDEDIATYTVESVNFRHSEVGYVDRTRKTLMSCESLQEYLSILFTDLRRLDAKFQEVFGYDTLEEAKQHERYLSRLLQTHSILDIYILHSQYFSNMTAQHVLYEKFFKIYPNLQGEAKDLILYEAFYDIHDEYDQNLQRRIMRTIFDRPEILSHIHDMPFDWLISTIDPAELDAENIPIRDRLTSL